MNSDRAARRARIQQELGAEIEQCEHDVQAALARYRIARMPSDRADALEAAAAALRNMDKATRVAKRRLP